MNFKFFLLPCSNPDTHAHVCVSLAQGLKSLGYKVLSDVVYWDEDLFINDLSMDWDVEILDWRYAYNLPYWSFDYRHKSNGKIKILVDRNTNEVNRPRWVFENWINNVDLILTVHGMIPVGKRWKKVKRWALGISMEAIKMIEESRGSCNEFHQDKLWISWNSDLQNRVLFEKWLCGHVNLKVVRQRISDKESTLLNTVGMGRFNKEYFRFLNGIGYTASICGYNSEYPVKIQKFYKNKNDTRSFSEKLRMRLNRNVLEKYVFKGLTPRTRMLMQWDSFRLWEAFYSDSVPVMFDFDYWRLDMEVRPRPWKDYIPIRNMVGHSHDFLADITEAERMVIARNGKEFFEVNYSPVAQAYRLLRWIEEL